MTLRTLRLALVTVLVGASLAIASTASAANPTATGPLTVPISSAQSNGVLNGVLTITNFAINDANQLVANGTFTGTAGGQSVTGTPVSAPVTEQAAGGSCQILDLQVNPLHLDLLGLVVDLSAVHLNVTAQQGPGNLLGNLLCALTGLLDNTGQANGTTAILNNVNKLLAG